MVLTMILATGAAVLAATVLYFSYRFNHWKKRGVPHPKPLPLVGNFDFILRRQKCFPEVIRDIALPFWEVGYCGMFQFSKPLLLVWDPEMVKQIVCKNFSSFHDRGELAHDNDPLSQHLFNLSGKKWRNLRNKLSPTFTSGKLKLMFPLMRDIGVELNAQLALNAKATDEVEVSTLVSRFSTDVIGSVAFGIQTNCLRDENNEFLNMSKQVVLQSPGQFIRALLESIHPKLSVLVPMKWIFSNVHNFFINLIKDTVEYREKNNVERNDFVQLMMELRKADLSNMDPENHMELTHGLMAAQSFIFFVAGLDNVSYTISFALHKMAGDPELQEKVAAEVSDVLRQHDGEMSYEALKKMDLVNRVVLEALRMWNPIGFLIRTCNETTKVGDLLIEKGQQVFLASQLTAMDESHFPDPTRFDPDRHTPEAKATRHPYAFLPFGEGPRLCIAERFALLEMKLAFALLLRDFSFTPGPSYEAEPVLDKKSFLPRPQNGFHLRVAARPR